jgi:hypothetical protein
VIRPSTRPASTILGLALLVAIALPPSADAHVVLDGEIVRPMLVDIARQLKDSRDAPSEADRLEAVYLLGEKVRQLVEFMNLDLLGHGQSLYADLLVKRLADYGVRIAFVERRRLYVSDLSPFDEYLRRAPRGPRAADARFRVIAETFHRSTSSRPSDVAEGDLEGLRKAIAQAESFLKEHPEHKQVKDVRFFLAMDYYRLARNSPDPATVSKYETLARLALQRIVQDYPGSAEAGSAEATLQTLSDAAR